MLSSHSVDQADPQPAVVLKFRALFCVDLIAKKTAVRSGILKMLDHDHNAESSVRNLFVDRNRAAWEWTYVHRRSDGELVSIRGCNLFEFLGVKIRRKSGFRKTL